MVNNTKRLVIACLSLIFVCNPATVYALSPEQREVFQSGVYYFNTEEDPPKPCTASTNLVGAENEDKIFNFFIGQGMQPFQAAGIMGNMKAESGLNPKRVQSTKTPEGDRDNITVDGKTGYGLVQWTSAGRQQLLADFAASKGLPSGDLGVQLENVMRELQTNYKKSAYDPLLASTNVDDATIIIMKHYEIPADQAKQGPLRQNFARDILARHGSGSNAGATSSGGTTCGGANSGQVVQGYSLPVDRKWYDEHQDWFTKAHHDYAAADLPVPNGTNIFSMTDGTVISVDTKGDCGAGIIVDRDDGVRIKYCHGSDGGSVSGAKAGDKVAAGQLIMHSSYTGLVKPPGPAGAHLHLEIVIGGKTHCPQSLFVGIANGNPPDPKSLPTTGCTN